MNIQESKKLEKKALEILKKYIGKNDTAINDSVINDTVINDTVINDTAINDSVIVTTVIIGVSGGPDSVFLLHLLSMMPTKIVVAHINHNLRKESKKDEDFVRKITSLIPDAIFECESADILKISAKSGKGIEETGRKTRYDFFQKLAKKYKANHIFTAHHADDNLETILLNLVRGAGLNGLSGMTEKENSLIRPLLGFSKKEIIEYLKLKKIVFRTDKSNTDTKYTRNFLRSKIIPSLKKINPNLTKTIAKNAETAREIERYIQNLTYEWLEKNANFPNNKTTHINAKKFRELPSPLMKSVIFESYKKLMGNTQNLESVHISECVQVALKNEGNKKKKLGYAIFAIKNNIITLKKS